MKLTAKDKEVAEKYATAKPKQFGNLHERMQYVMKLLREKRTSPIIDDLFFGDALWNALFDLQTEVSYHEPQSPPYGRRTL